MYPVVENDERHRANYILEQGTWRATCRVCGYFVKDPLRRRAASLFRPHIRDAAEAKELHPSNQVTSDNLQLHP